MAKYPMKAVYNGFGTIYREMTSDEYCEAVAKFECSIPRLTESKLRRDREYASYLLRWFSDQQCDGTPDIFYRFDHHLLPMSYTEYFLG